MNNRLPHRIGSAAAEYLLTAAVLIFALLCPVTAFGFGGVKQLLLTVALLTLALSIVFRLKYAWISFAGAGVLLGLLFLIKRAALISSFKLLGSHLIAVYNAGYHWFGDGTIGPSTLSAAQLQEIVPAMMFLAAVMSWLGSFAVSKVKSAFLLGVTVAPALVCCYILVDTAPKTVCVVLTVAGILLLALCQNGMKRNADRSWHHLLYWLLPAALLLTVIIGLQPEKDYNQTEVNARLSAWMEDARDRLDNLAPAAVANKALQEEEQVSLPDEISSPSSSVRVMSVTSSKSGVMYLRGMAYETFDGENWSYEGQPAGWDDEILCPGDGSGRAVVQIETAAVGNVLYLPYYPVRVPAGGETMSDICVLNKGNKETYSLTVSPRSIRCGAGYTKWVLRNCADLPRGLKDKLIAWWDEHTDLTPTPENIVKVVRGVASYSRSADKLPEGEEFVLWFLNDAERGYCVHYATVTAALLRAFDIPARFVTGFVTEVKSGVRTDVPAQNGHAWAEYYDEDAECWIPVDATPPEGIPAGSGNPAAALNRQQEPEPTEEPAETESAARPAQKPQQKPAPSAGGAKPAQTAESPSGKEFPVWLLVLLCVLAGFTLVVLQWFIRRPLIDLREESLPANERVCKRYLLYKKRCAHLKFEVPEGVAAIAQKAAYSPYTVTPEELQTFENAMRSAGRELSRGNFFRMLYCRFILAII